MFGLLKLLLCALSVDKSLQNKSLWIGPVKLGHRQKPP